MEGTLSIQEKRSYQVLTVNQTQLIIEQELFHILPMTVWFGRV